MVAHTWRMHQSSDGIGSASLVKKRYKPWLIRTNSCFVQSIGLIHPPSSAATTTALYPHILLRRGLQQQFPPNFNQQLRHFDRLNMTHQIPELGVIAIASQIGRVALLTSATIQYSDKYVQSHQLRSRSAVPPPLRTCPGFQIAAILPFKSQEHQTRGHSGVRPETPLLGFAISPILGSDTSTSRSSSSSVAGEKGRTGRYRLLMTYYDHTVLSYEISRGESGDELLVL